MTMNLNLHIMIIVRKNIMKKMMSGTGYVMLKMMMDQLIISHTNIVMNMMMECMNVIYMIMKKIF